MKPFQADHWSVHPTPDCIIERMNYIHDLDEDAFLRKRSTRLRGVICEGANTRVEDIIALQSARGDVQPDMAGPFQIIGAIPDPSGSTHDEAPIVTNVAETEQDFSASAADDIMLHDGDDNGLDEIEEVKNPAPLLIAAALPPEWGAHVVAGQKKSHYIARRMTSRMLEL